jgi:hypothetical protein
MHWAKTFMRVMKTTQKRDSSSDAPRLEINLSWQAAADAQDQHTSIPATASLTDRGLRRMFRQTP